MRQAGSGPSSTWQLQLAAMETLASESHGGRAPGKGAEKEEGKALEVANECCKNVTRGTQNRSMNSDVSKDQGPGD